MARVVGIDLGTTSSSVAVMESGRPITIQNSEGALRTPSVVAFSKVGERLVGAAAKRQAVSDPARTILSIKRHLGTRQRFHIDGRDFCPEEIAAVILLKLKSDAERYLGEEITKAVVSVPACLDEAGRRAVGDAATIAGIEILRVIDEPAAAAFAYGLTRQHLALRVLVFAIGGGACSVAVLELGGGVCEVKATAGDTHLGGDDWDAAIAAWLAEECQGQRGVMLDPVAWQRLRDASENARIDLSTVNQTLVHVPFIGTDSSGPRHLHLDVTRSRIERLTGGLVERCEILARRAIERSHLDASDLDRVLLVGGATRMPMIGEFLKRLTGREPNRDLNVDECVAHGAAVLGAVLSGEVNDVVLLDALSLTLGLETRGGRSVPVIECDTQIPTSKTCLFTIETNRVAPLLIHVLQGEGPRASDNLTIGMCHLGERPRDGVSHDEMLPVALGDTAPRAGNSIIEVTFNVDNNRHLSVTVKDRSSGRIAQVAFTAPGLLEKADVERMAARFRQDEQRERPDPGSSARLAPGVLLQGRYQIQTLLDSGGFGDVYLGRHLKLEVPVAIKVMQALSADADGQERFKQLFQREAKTLAALDHPNIAKIMDAFEEFGRVFLVMEFVNGVTLHDTVMKSGPLDEKRALETTSQAISALEYIHSRVPPVIMRDLKPANIMIGHNGRVKLIDFGIAKEFVQGTATNREVHGAATDGYAPLEQYGGTSDQRTDYYSLGATLYFMLTATHPPSAPERVARQIPLHDVSVVHPSVGRHVSLAIQRLMALALVERPSSLNEIRRMLGMDEHSQATVQVRCADCGTVNLVRRQVEWNLAVRCEHCGQSLRS